MTLRHTRPAIDPLFMSAADEYESNVMGIVLSGGDGDGAFGLRAITERGGTALATDHPKALPIEEIAQRVSTFCS